MKKSRRIVAILMAVAMMFGVFGCMTANAAGLLFGSSTPETYVYRASFHVTDTTLGTIPEGALVHFYYLKTSGVPSSKNYDGKSYAYVDENGNATFTMSVRADRSPNSIYLTAVPSNDEYAAVPNFDSNVSLGGRLGVVRVSPQLETSFSTIN